MFIKNKIATSNYRPLLTIRLLREVVEILADSFLALYFVQLADGDILPVGVYYLWLYTVMVVAIMIARKFLRSQRRIYILRTAIVFSFIFFLTLLILREQAADFAWLLGAIHGVEEGLFFILYNVYVSKLGGNEMPKYFGRLESIKSLLGIMVPILFGGMMDASGFESCAVVVMILAVVEIWSSWRVADRHLEKGEKMNLRQYWQMLKRPTADDTKKTKVRRQLIYSHLTSLANGLCFGGALNALVTVYVIRFFDTGLSLGILTSFFAIVTAGAGASLAKVLKKKLLSRKILIFCHVVVIFSLILMMIWVNPVTVVWFNFVRSFAKVYIEEINWYSTLKVSNLPKVVRRKEEYFITHELSIYTGRLISYGTFLSLALAETDWQVKIVMGIFVGFVVFQMWRMVKFNRVA